MTQPIPKSILLVDDDDIFRGRLARALRERELEVHEGKSAAEGLAIAKTQAPEGAVVDLRMPERSGLELLQDLVQLEPAPRVIMLTGYGSIATAVGAIQVGAAQYLQKPVDADEILDAFTRPAGDLGARPEPEQTPSLARAEWEHLQRVLHDCGGNISEAARRLGLHRRSLQRKLQKFPPQT